MNEMKKGHTVLPYDEPKQSIDCTLNKHIDSNIESELCQDFTEKSEIENKFLPKREMSVLLAESFSRLEMDKRAARVSECGTFLEFAHQIDGYGNVSEKGKLYNANFCRDRLCPMCSWRRSYKIFGQVSQIMGLIKNDYAFLFLTLTIPNVSASKLSESITELQKGWSKLKKLKRFKTAVKGYFKALEITYNEKRDDYHPHFHIVLAVNKSYFNSRTNDYIKRDEWLQMWRNCMGDESIMQVDIRRFKSKYSADEIDASNALASAIAEATKYAVKMNLKVMNDKVVKVLASVLHGRRLCEFDTKGAFGLARQKLQLDDAEDGDLIHLEEKIDPSIALLIVRYGWSAGAYQMLGTVVKSKE